MIFPLECIIAGKSEGSNKNIKEYVDMVHERYVLLNSRAFIHS